MRNTVKGFNTHIELSEEKTTIPKIKTNGLNMSYIIPGTIFLTTLETAVRIQIFKDSSKSTSLA